MCSTKPMLKIKTIGREIRLKIKEIKFEKAPDWNAFDRTVNSLLQRLDKLGPSGKQAATNYRTQIKDLKTPPPPTTLSQKLMDNAKQTFQQAYTALAKDFEQFARTNRIVKENHRINFDRAYHTITDTYKRVDKTQMDDFDKNELIKAFGAAHLQVAILQVNYVTIMIRKKEIIGKLQRINNNIKQPRAPHEILDATLKATGPLDILAQNGQFNLPDFQNVLKKQPAITANSGFTVLRNQLAENFDELRNQHVKNIKFKEDYKTIAGSYAEILGFLNDHFKQFIIGTHKTRMGRNHPIDYTVDIEQWQ